MKKKKNIQILMEGNSNEEVVCLDRHQSHDYYKVFTWNTQSWVNKVT